MDLGALRHSASHIMADAVKSLFPDVKLGIGPSIEDGFYYDFDREEPFVPDDLLKIEKRMAEIIKKNSKFEQQSLKKSEARTLFEKMGEKYKVELIDALTDKEVTIYRHGDFVDLCKGPHVKTTGEVKAFKLLSLAGAYWHGIETNPMLQRIYGTAFTDKKELQEYLKVREEAAKRDHRRLGRELDLFSLHNEVGAGLVFYHPKGAMIRSIIEDWEKKEHLRRGYQMVMTPHIMKSDIWVRSGHYDYYKDNMYIFEIEDKEFAVKPMNCPGHMLIYKTQKRSYRELPLRYFELANVYRNEKSGVLHGLLRVRGFTQDDAHIFCTEEQVTGEVIGVIDFVTDALNMFGFKEFGVELSTRPTKSIGTDAQWKQAEGALTEALKAKGLKYQINEGDGAFYGPKIDIKLKDALKREWQCATVQCDFALSERFDLTYDGADGKEHRPVMLHRVILGSMERFLGALIEHYAGAFPLWLAPVQAVVIPITDEQADYAKEIASKLRQEGIRVECDLRREKMQYKIRAAQMQKVPYMLVAGKREQEAKKIAVRSRQKGDEGVVTIDELANRIKIENDQKQ